MQYADTRRVKLAGALSLLLATGALVSMLSVAPASAAPSMSVVATGLDNPKQPALGPDGAIYVACSGNAGPTDALLDTVPFNKSGAVVRVSTTGEVTPLVSGLLSRFDEGSSIGPSGIAFWRDAFYVAQGLYDPLNAPTDTLLSSPVLKVTPIGKVRTFTSFTALPFNPATTSEPDTNPFACAVGSDNRLYVSDGGENAVWAVSPNGDYSMVVQFSGDPTVTGVATAPFPPGNGRGLGRNEDGFGRRNERFSRLVVCKFGNGAGGFKGGQVVTVDTRGHEQTLVPSGVIDMPIAVAYSPSGRLYVLQFATPATTPGPPFAPNTGAIWAVSSTGAATKVLTGLNFPTGMTFGADGDAYVTNKGITPAGELVRVTGLS